MNDKIQLKRGTLENWLTADPILLDGEMALVATNTATPNVYDQYKVGGGSKKFSELPYQGLPCLQELGDSTTSPLSQKAITDWINKGYQFRGIATPSTNPGTPDGPVFYLATEAGTYANFNRISVADGEAVILEWNNGAWTKKTTGLATTYASVKNSTNNYDELSPSSIRNDGIMINTGEFYAGKGSTYFFNVKENDVICFGCTFNTDMKFLSWALSESTSGFDSSKNYEIGNVISVSSSIKYGAKVIAKKDGALKVSLPIDSTLDFIYKQYNIKDIITDITNIESEFNEKTQEISNELILEGEQLSPHQTQDNSYSINGSYGSNSAGKSTLYRYNIPIGTTKIQIVGKIAEVPEDTDLYCLATGSLFSSVKTIGDKIKSNSSGSFFKIIDIEEGITNLFLTAYLQSNPSVLKVKTIKNVSKENQQKIISFESTLKTVESGLRDSESVLNGLVNKLEGIIRNDNSYIKSDITRIEHNSSAQVIKYAVKGGKKYLISGITNIPTNGLVYGFAPSDVISFITYKGPTGTGEEQVLNEIITTDENITVLLLSKNKNYDVNVYEYLTDEKEEEILETTEDKRFDWLAMDFIKKISPFTEDSGRENRIMFYCLPDMHLGFSLLPQHAKIFKLSDNLSGSCRIAVTAGDMFYMSSTKDIKESIVDFIDNTKKFDESGTFLFPAIGGHDFNNVSDNNNQYNGIGENLTKAEQRELIIQPCIDLANGAQLTINIDKKSDNNVDGVCYYCIIDNYTNTYHIILDEADHPNLVVGTYNGQQTKIKLTSINIETETFSGETLEGEALNGIPFGDFNYVYNRYKSCSYQQAQMDWFISTLKSVPKDKKIAIFNHTGLRRQLTDNSGTTKAMEDILKAFVNRTTYSGSNTDENGFAWSVNVDFSGDDTLGGLLLGVFIGHQHKIGTKLVDNTYYEFMSSNGGAYPNSNGSYSLMYRIEGDVFIFNTDNKLRRFHIGRQGVYADPTKDLSDYAGVDIPKLL